MNNPAVNEDLVILVVDDLQANLYSMQQMLSEIDVKIETALSAEDGLKYMLNNPVHILILDYSMPQMNGAEMAEIIRLQFSEPPPILFVTAHGHNVPGLEKLCYQTGAIDFIEKPVKEEVLLAKLNVLLTLTKQKSELSRLARIDPLTQIKNRLSFNDELKQNFSQAKRQASSISNDDNVSLALLAFDLDEFKQINDEYGHDAGDAVLKGFADRLSETVRDSDLVARLGGDEFMALLTNISVPEQADIVARKILQACETPVEYKGLSLPLKVSIGIALYPQHANTIEELLKASDLALYQAKKMGRGIINLLVDSSTMDEDELEKHLDIECQAVFDESESLIGGEILARIHGVDGCNNISEAIQHFKETGLADMFERVVCDKLTREVADIGEDKSRGAYLLFINKNLQDLLRRDHVENLLLMDKLLRKRNIIMVIDIDGWTSLPIDSHYFNALIHLANQNVALCLQDVGEHTIPCEILRKIHFTYIKMSRSVINDMDNDEFVYTTASSVCHLAHSNGAQVVAVGVESSEQVIRLKAIGCDYYQGNFFDKPVSFQNFDSRYSHQKTKQKSSP